MKKPKLLSKPLPDITSIITELACSGKISDNKLINESIDREKAKNKKDGQAVRKRYKKNKKNKNGGNTL